MHAQFLRTPQKRVRWEAPAHGQWIQRLERESFLSKSNYGATSMVGILHLYNEFSFLFMEKSPTEKIRKSEELIRLSTKSLALGKSYGGEAAHVAKDLLQYASVAKSG